MQTKKAVSEHAEVKQHAKITEQVFKLYDELKTDSPLSGPQRIADALRDARLDEQREYTLYPIAHYYKSSICECQKCRRIAALERGEQ